MGQVGSTGVTALWVMALAATGCGSPPPPAPPAQPAAPTAPEPEPASSQPAAAEKEKVSSGMECAPAEAECQGGVCSVTLKSGCDQPITCELAIVANCKSGSSMVEAKARSRGTVPAKSEGKLSAAANCTEGQVVNTELQELRCR
jgi:hypothetical protein